MFPLDYLILALVGGGIEKCDMQFLTEAFAPPYLWNNTLDTVEKLKEGKPPVKP